MKYYAKPPHFDSWIDAAVATFPNTNYSLPDDCSFDNAANSAKQQLDAMRQKLAAISAENAKLREQCEVLGRECGAARLLLNGIPQRRTMLLKLPIFQKARAATDAHAAREWVKV